MNPPSSFIDAVSTISTTSGFSIGHDPTSIRCPACLPRISLASSSCTLVQVHRPRANRRLQCADAKTHRELAIARQALTFA